MSCDSVLRADFRASGYEVAIHSDGVLTRIGAPAARKQQPIFQQLNCNFQRDGSAATDTGRSMMQRESSYIMQFLRLVRTMMRASHKYGTSWTGEVGVWTFQNILRFCGDSFDRNLIGKPQAAQGSGPGVMHIMLKFDLTFDSCSCRNTFA